MLLGSENLSGGDRAAASAPSSKEGTPARDAQPREAPKETPKARPTDLPTPRSKMPAATATAAPVKKIPAAPKEEEKPVVSQVKKVTGTYRGSFVFSLSIPVV